MLLGELQGNGRRNSSGSKIVPSDQPERKAVLEEAKRAAYVAADLDRPFFVRSFGY